MLRYGRMPVPIIKSNSHGSDSRCVYNAVHYNKQPSVTRDQRRVQPKGRQSLNSHCIILRRYCLDGSLLGKGLSEVKKVSVRH